MDVKVLNTNALAYMGDSVFEVYARKKVLEEGNPNVDVLHKHAIKYVHAEGQEVMLKGIEGILTEEEESVVRRARNHKLAASKKNSKKDVMTDKNATAFEALVGYLYLKNDKERLEYIISESFRVIDGKEGEHE